MSNEISIEEIEAILKSVFEEATNRCITFVESDEIQTTFYIANEVGDNLAKNLNSLKFLLSVASIPSRLFLNKFIRFCKGVIDIPIEKRKKYIEKIGKKKFNKESVFVLNVINRIEELNKLEVFLKILEARLVDKISDEDFHRYTMMVDNTPLSDINYMKNNLKNDSFFLETIQDESLLNYGWLKYIGDSWLEPEDQRDSACLYSYSLLAKDFCKKVFGLEANDEMVNGPIMSQKVFDE